MRFSLHACRLLALLGLCGWPASLVAGEDNTRTFPVAKCRYALPGPDWHWIDKRPPKVVFMAGNTKGFVLNLATMDMPTPVPLDEQFVKGFEKSFYHTGQLERRAVPGVPGLAELSNGRQAGRRENVGHTVFSAHGLMYTLTLVGGKEPIEADPTFETVMEGFAFTTPPEPEPKRAGSVGVAAPPGPPGPTPGPANAAYGKALNFSERMGRLPLCAYGGRCPVHPPLGVSQAQAQKNGGRRESANLTDTGPAVVGILHPTCVGRRRRLGG